MSINWYRVLHRLRLWPRWYRIQQHLFARPHVIGQSHRHRRCTRPPYLGPRQRSPSRAGAPSPGPVRAVRASGLPAAPRAGPPLARGASGPPWQGVRQGVQRGVCEPAPARGGAVVGGKGRLIFLYSAASASTLPCASHHAVPGSACPGGVGVRSWGGRDTPLPAPPRARCATTAPLPFGSTGYAARQAW